MIVIEFLGRNKHDLYTPFEEEDLELYRYREILSGTQDELPFSLFHWMRSILGHLASHFWG